MPGMALGKRKRQGPKHLLGPKEKAHNAPGLQGEFVAPKALALYYRNVVSLRTFVLDQLDAERAAIVTSDADVNELLDSVLVASSADTPKDSQAVKRQLNSYVKQSKGELARKRLPLDHSHIVDVAICRLFDTLYPARMYLRPPHQLCHGFQRGQIKHSDHTLTLLESNGIISRVPNEHLSEIKGQLWTKLYERLGKDANILMLHLLINCGLYVQVKSGVGNYYQLSGVSLFDMPLLSDTTVEESNACNGMHSKIQVRTPAKIVFVRSRMLYARPALNAQGEVRFGLKHIHVFNRYSDPSNLSHTVNVLKYMFPRQFGLHNVFSLEISSGGASQPLKDYTLRENEIAQQCKRRNLRNTMHLPKRLRGDAFEIIKSIQRRHRRCPYRIVLDHYCPIPSLFLNYMERLSTNPLLAEGRSDAAMDSTTMACPLAQVSAFCQSIIHHLIPPGFFGLPSVRAHNRAIIMKRIDRFLVSRKFETLTLHDVLQDLKIHDISWLASDKSQTLQRLPLSETRKRLELMSEALYFIFDSILVPLIRSNFYVTEANATKNKLFFFRHDVWRALSSPSLSSLQIRSYEEIRTNVAEQTLARRSLGYSQMRLLPKSNGFRPIMNLRRREIKTRFGKQFVTRSINSIMTPVHTFMTFEKTRHPELFGSAMFSVGEIFPKLKAFKADLAARGLSNRKLYFAKIDVTACFDTIPQEKLLELVETLAKEEVYHIDRYAEIRGPENDQYSTATSGKPRRKFVKLARAAQDHERFSQTVESMAANKRDTVFVDHVVPSFQRKGELLKLLKDHIQENLVKIGKKYYRQREGIPQGSVISTISANFFYAAFEREHLAFINLQDGVLLRLIDDFLFITLHREEAVKFMETTHLGHPDYGFAINPAKSLANFEFSTKDQQIKTLTGHLFPYCGQTIHTQTLGISRASIKKNPSLKLSDSLTVEYGRTPGRTFHRKILAAFKIQVAPMTSDARYNGHLGALINICTAFLETAEKYYAYAKSLGHQRMPRITVQTKTISDLAEMSCKLLQSKSVDNDLNDERYTGPKLKKSFAIPSAQIRTLCFRAFLHALERRQTGFKEVIAWLRGEVLNVMPKGQIEMKAVLRAEELALDRLRNI